MSLLVLLLHENLCMSLESLRIDTIHYWPLFLACLLIFYKKKIYEFISLSGLNFYIYLWLISVYYIILSPLCKLKKNLYLFDYIK